MKDIVTVHPWKVIEDHFDEEIHPITESLMSIGNGRMGQRANFEEPYSGESLQGSYIGGVYYPDKTRVGWWKNGYPEYFAKVPNSVNWIGLDVLIDDKILDMHQSEISDYVRTLDMRKGLLTRAFTAKTSRGKKVIIRAERFYSLGDLDMCFLKYSIRTHTDEVDLKISPYLDFNIKNSDANYDEVFWEDKSQGSKGIQWVSAKTKKTDFLVAAAVNNFLVKNGESIKPRESHQEEGRVSEQYHVQLGSEEEITIYKIVSITSSFYYNRSQVVEAAKDKVSDVSEVLYDTSLARHTELWADRWEHCDIKITGDDKAQQGIRFNIFQLYQTYSGEDARLNIGPKGFTGEKYGGSTYWDTEAYCLPFYMFTTESSVAKNLLVYRYNHLQKAIENAEKLGFEGGAALYPMVTMNGEECHNEWEITFEEIHRNGAIAFAIYNYIRCTGDHGYLKEYGLEVLIGIARFWAQRVHMSPDKKKYVMLGVTGPNEYENNVDNNWYTNYIARWCLEYAASCIRRYQEEDHLVWQAIGEKTGFDESELEIWDNIVKEIYLPKIEDSNVFLQHDGYLDKENKTVADLKPEDRPINQNWSWDRILRSPYIKQADVLQGLYFFEDQFTEEEIRDNFLYYEPRTVHESSLSPCIHAILAAKLGMKDKAYEMYLRTARLDLDDYNNDAEDGCHITSMAGTWLSIVEGFAGLRVKDQKLYLSPFLPDQWEGYQFTIMFRGTILVIDVQQDKIEIHNKSEAEIGLSIYGEQVHIPGDGRINKMLN